MLGDTLTFSPADWHFLALSEVSWHVLPLNLVQICMVSRGWILMTLVFTSLLAQHIFTYRGKYLGIYCMDWYTISSRLSWFPEDESWSRPARSHFQYTKYDSQWPFASKYDTVVAPLCVLSPGRQILTICHKPLASYPDARGTLWLSLSRL